MSARRPDAAGAVEAATGDDRVVAHLVLDAKGAVMTEFVTERELDTRGRPSRSEIEALFGSWGHLDADALLDELEGADREPAPTPVRDDA